MLNSPQFFYYYYCPPYTHIVSHLLHPYITDPTCLIFSAVLLVPVVLCIIINFTTSRIYVLQCPTILFLLEKQTWIQSSQAIAYKERCLWVRETLTEGKPDMFNSHLTIKNSLSLIGLQPKQKVLVVRRLIRSGCKNLSTPSCGHLNSTGSQMARLSE